MLVGRCYSELSGHKHKKSQPLSGSASQIDRVTQRFGAESKDLGDAVVVDAHSSFLMKSLVE